MELLPRLRTPPPPHETPLHIDDLGDPILVLILEQLPLEDLLRVGAVSPDWERAQSIVCRARKSLCLMGPHSKYTTVSLHSRFGITYDQFNCYRLEWHDLTGDFCRHLAATFPNVTALEFAGHSDQHTFYFLTRLFGKETWFPKLTALKLVIGPLSYANNDEDDAEFMYRIQNHFYGWNDLLEDINFAQFAGQLKHLTLYNANILRDFRNVPLNIVENFTNFTALEELYFGVQCENIADVIFELRHMKALKKFVLFDDEANVAQERNIHQDLDQLAAVAPAIMRQITELCLVYSHEEVATNVLCVDNIAEHCRSLTDLHLYCMDLPLRDLFDKLSHLEHLNSLRLSGFNQNYFDKPKDVPALKHLHTLHLNCTRLMNYSHLKSLVEQCLPAIRLIQQNGLSGLYFMDDFLFPEEDPYIDDSKQRLVVMSPNKRIKAEVERYQNSARTAARYRKATSLANVQLESASLIFLEQLFPLLTRFVDLKHLRMECPADNFAFFGSNILSMPACCVDEEVRLQLDTLQTLHLECASTGGDLPCPRTFAQTASYWPNVQLLKLDGLRARRNYFHDLSPSEHEFLASLAVHFRKLRKVLLIKDCTMPRKQLPTPSSSSPTSSHNASPLSPSSPSRLAAARQQQQQTASRVVNFYSLQFLFHANSKNANNLDNDDATEGTPPELMLMVGQKITF